MILKGQSNIISYNLFEVVIMKVNFYPWKFILQLAWKFVIEKAYSICKNY